MAQIQCDDCGHEQQVDLGIDPGPTCEHCGSEKLTEIEP